MRYFLSLGSNVGDRRANIARALEALEKAKVKVLRSSSLYRTQPVGFTAQPWFHNRVVEVSAGLEPGELLALIKTIERRLGRRPALRNRPRSIDIDILMAGDCLVKTRELSVPHPRMAERNFVLVPLLEIAPRAVHPLLKKSISELYENTLDKSAVLRIAGKKVRPSSRKSGLP